MTISLSAQSEATRTLALLAPSRAAIPAACQYVEASDGLHAEYLAELQILRGGIYLADGAIRPDQLDANGRHQVRADQEAWHLLSLDAQGRVRGCARYRSYQPGVRVEELGVSTCPLARSVEWSAAFREAVESEIALAEREKLAYVEVGGWALGEELRASPEALRLALASYALAEALGGCLSISTVTRRHGSAQILRRIGGRPLVAGGVELPAYFDQGYNCWMEVLRFDSRAVNPLYFKRSQMIREMIQRVPIICGGTGIERLSGWLRNSSTAEARTQAGWQVA
jgi:hypothetical protein